MMDKYGLIGFPLGHSFSAKYFNNKFEKESISAEYLNFEIENISSINDILAQHNELKGMNVTIPHKESVIPFLSSLSTDAQKIGAVNTIKVEKNVETNEYSLIGYNTDYIGFKNSISPLINSKIHSKALVLGTGGASKAITHALDEMNIEWIYVSRTRGEKRIAYKDVDASLMNSHNVIVNCSPIGTYPNIDECPDIPYEYITENHLLYDLVYNPSETLFLRKGKQNGAITKNGAEMLELQALAAWDIWNK